MWGVAVGEAVRSVIWLGDSRKQVKEFPPEVRQSLGSALYDAQQGDKAPVAKPFKGVGSGVFEIAIRFKTDAYRAVYAVQIGEQVYVLHAFQKKSKSGSKTLLQDIEIIKRRYRQAVEMEKGQ
jgi:phage-related protein